MNTSTQHPFEHPDQRRTPAYAALRDEIAIRSASAEIQRLNAHRVLQADDELQSHPTTPEKLQQSLTDLLITPMNQSILDRASALETLRQSMRIVRAVYGDLAITVQTVPNNAQLLEVHLPQNSHALPEAQALIQSMYQVGAMQLNDGSPRGDHWLLSTAQAANLQAVLDARLQQTATSGK